VATREAGKPETIGTASARKTASSTPARVGMSGEDEGGGAAPLATLARCSLANSCAAVRRLFCSVSFFCSLCYCFCSASSASREAALRINLRTSL
jgi:hypothetical protein